MEIERKFLIDRFPDLPELQRSYMGQGYLCTQPTVRIRSKRTSAGTSYRLCIKGKGTLAREELEWEITQDEFHRLEALLPAPLVRKEQRVYQLADGLELECNLVDPEAPTSFYYAEVEFPSIEAANAFQPPSFLGREVTEIPGYTMGSYWRMKLGQEPGVWGSRHNQSL